MRKEGAYEKLLRLQLSVQKEEDLSCHLVNTLWVFYGFSTLAYVKFLHISST